MTVYITWKFKNIWLKKKYYKKVDPPFPHIPKKFSSTRNRTWIVALSVPCVSIAPWKIYINTLDSGLLRIISWGIIFVFFLSTKEEKNDERGKKICYWFDFVLLFQEKEPKNFNSSVVYASNTCHMFPADVLFS